jgi:hypothetical protein
MNRYERFLKFEDEFKKDYGKLLYKLLVKYSLSGSITEISSNLSSMKPISYDIYSVPAQIQKMGKELKRYEEAEKKYEEMMKCE